MNSRQIDNRPEYLSRQHRYRSDALIEALHTAQEKYGHLSVELLGQLAEQLQLQDSSLCGLGMAAPNPVLSTLRWFRDEYEEHIRSGRCPGGVCSSEDAP